MSDQNIQSVIGKNNFELIVEKFLERRFSECIYFLLQSVYAHTFLTDKIFFSCTFCCCLVIWHTNFQEFNRLSKYVKSKGALFWFLGPGPWSPASLCKNCLTSVQKHNRPIPNLFIDITWWQVFSTKVMKRLTSNTCIQNRKSTGFMWCPLQNFRANRVQYTM